jgi:Lon protease-like protein
MSAPQERGSSAPSLPSTPSHSRPSSPRAGTAHLPDDSPAGNESTPELLLGAAKHARQIVRLLQCGVCSRILREPMTLPCGQSLCKSCLPQTRMRTNISWPATENRLQGFECPFAECKRAHALGDCSVDVTLNKVLQIVRTAFEATRLAAEDSAASTCIAVTDSWAVAGRSALGQKDDESHILKGGRILSTYMLAEASNLQYGHDLTYTAVGATEEELAEVDDVVFSKLKEAVRVEMDCQICYALYLDPLTTTCGHTFCRHCLQRVLGTSRHCPVCRRALSIHPQVNPNSTPSNERLKGMITGFWTEKVEARTRAVRTEHQTELAGEFDIPLFVCTLSFPAMPTFLHVFEPRYRLMIRRAMEADRTFGMVLPARPSSPGANPFCEIGTLLRIVNIEFFPDGRSLLETVGVSRFRVSRHGYLDGYVVGKVEKVDDVSIAEEEAAEIAETTTGQGIQTFITRPLVEGETTPLQDIPAAQPPLSVDDLDTKSTRELVDIGAAFVSQMRGQSVSWLTARVLAVFGECPTDPVLFPWWLASVLPVSDDEKYRLLGTSSVRQRMKICCQWIVEWESSRW